MVVIWSGIFLQRDWQVGLVIKNVIVGGNVNVRGKNIVCFQSDIVIELVVILNVGFIFDFYFVVVSLQVDVVFKYYIVFKLNVFVWFNIDVV